jgi:hypothetical protein
MDIALSTNAELDITTEFLNLPVYFAPVAPLLCFGYQFVFCLICLFSDAIIASFLLVARTALRYL